jgi:multiple RNA-binding domain-containing protein 1
VAALKKYDAEDKEKEIHPAHEVTDSSHQDFSTGRLFVRNLPYTTTEEELQELFKPFGQITELHIPVDESKRSRGYAFILYMFPDHAKAAFTALHNSIFQGRCLHIVPAMLRPGADSGIEREGAGELSWKQKKENERRQQAGDDSSWNAAFVRSDAVVDAVSDRLRMSKGELLNAQEGNMAVRMAMMETFVTVENRLVCR